VIFTVTETGNGATPGGGTMVTVGRTVPEEITVIEA
jgi:hypothetical protein